MSLLIAYQLLHAASHFWYRKRNGCAKSDKPSYRKVSQFNRDTEGCFLRFEVVRSSRLPLHIIVSLVQLPYKWYATVAPSESANRICTTATSSASTQAYISICFIIEKCYSLNHHGKWRTHAATISWLHTHENTCESPTTWMHARFSLCGAASHSKLGQTE